MIDIDIKFDLDTANGKMEAHYKVHISPGELITLFGESGAGKTTLLRLIAGLETPKSGLIAVDDKIWFDSKKKINLPIQKRSIGFVFQDYALFPNMNIRENLLFANPKGDIEKMLEITELKNLELQNINSLSGGQKQRVALARALMRNPNILLLDEPLSALDEEMRNKLQEEVKLIHDTFNITTILVSHDKAECIRLSDKVALLSNGRIEKVGTPIEIFGDKSSQSIYGEVIKIEKNDDTNKIYLLVGNSIVAIDLDNTDMTQYSMGQKIELGISKITKEQ
jgi:molybdate transport system ATP-binding protein